MDEGMLSPSDKEESAARCHICGSSLTYPEIINYGNRCLFCCAPGSKKDISMWQFLQHARLDLLIYKNMLIWSESQEDNRIKLISYLGEVGARYWEDLTLKTKKELLKALRRK